MEKVIRDGLVAVVYSPGFGAGWYSWNTDHQELLFHPKIVELIEKGQCDSINEDWIQNELGLEDVFTGGARDLQIEWLPQGTAFTIDEYDGSESIVTYEHIDLIA